MSGNVFIKDPQAILDYRIDWSLWLATGDEIIASTWTVPTGIVKDSDAFGAASTTVWLSGGTVNTDYILTNHITTADGREDDRMIVIQVRNR